MNGERLLCLSCFGIIVFTASLATAGQHGRRGAAQPAVRGAPRYASTAFASSGRFPQWNSTASARLRQWNGVSSGRLRQWNGASSGRFGQWNGASSGRFRQGDRDWHRWHRHRDDDDRFVFVGSFGFPFYDPWPYPYYGYYPYNYYPSDYQYYSYDQSGYQGYDRPIYQGGAGVYRGSIVLEVQRRLAREGYYYGAIDGVMGSRTYYAIRAYERRHGLRVDGMIGNQLLATMGLG